MNHPISTQGLGLLNRRNFLSSAAGLGLATLLPQNKTLATSTAIRPIIEPQNPLRARAAHFPPKAKRVLVMFCSGAVSHLDSWDWKPELMRMDGKPMPGAKENFFRVKTETWLGRSTTSSRAAKLVKWCLISFLTSPPWLTT